nr:16S rRNA (cytidine(1402)-2'-O)-methyltransferase [Bacillus horti]
MTEQGTLFLVPTPIGNLEDITYRALEILKNVDYIAAEDTRHTKKLLHYFEISKPMISYHEHNKLQSGEKILRDLENGQKVALVTDAGMPGISDPGADIVKEAVRQQINVVSLPGANAALTALVASGVETDQFLFIGFLDRHKKRKIEQLELIKTEPYTLIFYEAPHRIKETVAAIHHVFGDRQVALARELSKKHEEYVRGTTTELAEYVQHHELKGEICLIVTGADPAAIEAEKEALWWESLSVKQHVESYIEKGQSSKEAIKQVAQERNVPKRDVYQSYHVEE